jgi:hypothetical protein
VNELPWSFLALVLSVLLTLALGLYAWVASIRSALDARLGKLEREDGVLGERVSHLPTQSDVGELQVGAAEAGAELEAAQRSIDAIWQRLELIEEWLRHRENEREKD